MDFSLDIGELTATIREYENVIKDLEEQKENINKAIKVLTDLGWSGEAKDKFMENHIKKQEFYTKLIEDIKYEKNALENEEKPRAIQLKKRCEGFEDCIKRSAGGASLTNDDTGVISLQYGGQFPINNNVDECTNDYYRKMNSKFVEILSLVNSLTFTTFPIIGDVESEETSLRNQTTSLTEFDTSFNTYCSGVRDMEENICSVFSKISGITEGTFKIRGMQIISENGQVDKNKVIELMLKHTSDLTKEEIEILGYAKIVLGDDYNKLKEIADKHNGPTVEEAAAIAEDVYFENYDEAIKHELPGGWKLCDYHNGGTSLQIGVYERVGKDGKIEYIIANRGSRDWNEHKEDWVNNAQQLLGKSPDVKASLIYVDKFLKNHPNANITFVGHSKGGAEAAANALEVNKNAILFNPAAVSIWADGLRKEKAAYKGNMTSYIVKGEIVSNLEINMLGAKPIDNVVYLPKQYPNETLTDGNAIKNHLMPAVKAAIKEQEEREN